MNKERQIDKEIRLAFQTEHLLHLWRTTPPPKKYDIAAELLRTPSRFPKTKTGRVLPLTTYWQEKLAYDPDMGYMFKFLKEVLEELTE